MRNDFKELLDKCAQKDFESLSKMLDSRISFFGWITKNGKICWKRANATNLARSDLIKLMDKQIRYYGSADGAYFIRCLLNNPVGNK